MIRYDLRFWSKDEKRMITGAGLSPNQKPLVRQEDGSYRELEGRFIPMICTHQRAVNGLIWEADIIECDIPALAMEGMPVSYIKARGIMQFVQATGAFTLNIQAASQELAGATFQVSNSRIIGNAFANPELLTANKPKHDESNNAQQAEKGGEAGASKSS